MKVSWSNVFAVLVALYVGVTCTGCASTAPAAFEQQSQPAQLKFNGLRAVVPGAFERGVWGEVEVCLHRAADIDAIRLGLADAILDLEGRRFLYGVYAFVDWPEGTTPTVVVDRAVRYSARVWSHEFVHVLAGVPDGDWLLGACTLIDGPHDLPSRPFLEGV